MSTALILVERLRRRSRAVIAAVLAGGLVAVAASAAVGAPAASPPPGDLSDFELGGTAGVVDFKFSYPNLVLPYVITGGVLDSFSLAAGTGRAQGVAGPMPIP
ncbi:MAG TPA: hypothetical protein VEG38_05015, partial [Acidimicrobiia bacterium]|nr:hypothetical protein [Acidimicrobiia bacterium]